MFGKKCSKCNKKASKGYDFCPFCGNSFKFNNSKEDKEDYGILGRDDFIDGNPFISSSSSTMDKLFDSAFKMAEKLVEKQMRVMSEEMKENRPQPNSVNSPNSPSNLDIQFFVNGKRVFPQSVQKVPVSKTVPKDAIKIENNLSKLQIEKFSKFPKSEPASKIRRLSGKLIYELEVPGVKDIEDVIINQLENSIEIKALGKDKVYSKILNLNLPILDYRLSKGNLVLELKA
ncbi:MAG: zinc ribbon domain-containing protein [Candidatus Pacearchaeota archaeon]|jgi:HSP20 family molecular chaperone IbpA